MNQSGKNIILRPPEPEDLEVLYQWENDLRNRMDIAFPVPFSKRTLRAYLNSVHSLNDQKQLRLMICLKKGHARIGCVDLFDFDAMHLRAGIGILIGDEKNRNKGYATEALRLLIAYCANVLQLHQLYCDIETSNKASISLFRTCGFEQSGVKKQWLRSRETWKDVLLMQLIL